MKQENDPFFQDLVRVEDLNNGTWSCSQLECRKMAKYVWIKKMPPMVTRMSGLCGDCANKVVKSNKIELPSTDA